MAETICVGTVRMDGCGVGPRNGLDQDRKQWSMFGSITVGDKSYVVCFEAGGQDLVTHDWITQASRKALQ